MGKHTPYEQGGRLRPPSLFTLILPARKTLCASALLCLVSLAPSHAQRPFGRPFGRPQNGMRPYPNQRPNGIAGLPPAQQIAVGLLQRMARPRINYSGEQITEVTARGGRMSRQKVIGDALGRVRREFLEPDALQGDLMITAPDRYHYYHKRTNILDIALWPMEESQRSRQTIQKVLQGRLQAERVGEEVVAGRNAAILLITMHRNEGGRQVKFWIDQETGILLRNEISNFGGLVSRTYFTSIQVGIPNPPARLFEPPNGQGVTPNLLLPAQPQFATLEEAQGRLPFQPLLPAVLPKGYQANGVWVMDSPAFPQLAQAGVAVRYSDGVGSFILFQRLLRMQIPDRGVRMSDGNRSVQHWLSSAADGRPLSITYIGHLPQGQAEEMKASMR